MVVKLKTLKRNYVLFNVDLRIIRIGLIVNFKLFFIERKFLINIKQCANFTFLTSIDKF
jgi:hypothetical protein